jgi:fatty-acyl-CoA synthase
MPLLIGDLLADAATARPAAIAATIDERSITFGELDVEANRVSNALQGHGVSQGDVVAWWSPGTFASIAGFAAVARLGAVFAPLNPALRAEEMAGVIDYLGPRLLVAGDEPLHEAARTATEVPAVTVDQLIDSGVSTSAPNTTSIDDGATHVIYLTSGTTGTPKGVEVSHRASWLRSFPGGSTFAAGLRGDGGILASFPLFHYGGWHYVLEAWHHRCAFHICRRFDGEVLIDAARRWRPSAMYCIPAVWERVLAALPDGDQRESTSLASVLHADTGTSAASQSLLDRLKSAMPHATRSVLYGSSEGGHHTTLFDRQLDDHPGSVGRAAPPGLIALSEEGEVLYRSPTLMNGYYRLPDQTAAALRDGWYHTGDVGLLDHDGFLYITGRLREVIRTGGETVAPSEVEAALDALPGLLDVAVVGLPDPAWGEVVAAAVVTARGGKTPDVAAIRAHLDGSLAPYKHPRLVVEVSAIPRTAATGQVQRTLLRDELLRLVPPE